MPQALQAYYPEPEYRAFFLHVEGWVMICNMLYNRRGVISHLRLHNTL